MASLASCPTQELATEWAAKKPAVMTTMPEIIAHRPEDRLSATPPIIIKSPPPST